MATADCRSTLPPDLAERGPAEQVFDLATSSLSNQQILAIVGYAVSVVPVLVIGVPLLICAFKPFGKNAPPPVVCLGIGCVAIGCALALAYTAYRKAVAGPRAAAAYHLFRDGLAIVGPGPEQRWVAWEQIGPEQAPVAFEQQHVFPVDGAADIVFDHAAADHGELATALTARSTRARWTRLLDGATVPATGRPAPYFLIYDHSDTGLFRVSPIAGRLLFLRVGDGCAAGTRGFKALNMPVQGGLVGGVNGWMQMKALERMQQALDSLAGADERQLFEQAMGFRGSRLIRPEELAELHFAAPGTWEKMTTGAAIVGVLHFKHAAWGEKKLYFESLAQVGEAARLLEDLLGRDFRPEAARLASCV